MNPSSKRIRIGDSLDKIKRDEARGQPRLNLLSPPCSAPIYCRVWFCSGCLALISANRGRGETFRDSRTIDPAVRQTTTEWGWDRDRCEWEKASQQTWHDGGVTRVHKMKASPLARCSQPSPEGGAVLMRRRNFLAGSWAQETSWSWLIGNTNGAAGVERSQGSMSISWQLIGATRWPLGEANWTTASSTQWAGSAAETHQSFFFFARILFSSFLCEISRIFVEVKPLQQQTGLDAHNDRLSLWQAQHPFIRYMNTGMGQWCLCEQK